MLITSWSAWNKKEKQYEHNHIENWWVRGSYPKPLKPEFKAQKAWKNKKWKKEFCFLIQGKVCRPNPTIVIYGTAWLLFIILVALFFVFDIKVEYIDNCWICM